MTPERQQAEAVAFSKWVGELDRRPSQGQPTRERWGSEDSDEKKSPLCRSILFKLRCMQYDCVVCCEPVRPTTAVWSCKGCYALFHLTCMKRWAAKSAEPSPAMGMLPSAPKLTTEWRCPLCNKGYPHSTKLEYTCFCGRVRNPPRNSYLDPHSCGQPCNATRSGTPCPHLCFQLCHPGPCAGCTLQSAPKSCYCGKTQYRTGCDEIDPGRSCGDTCDKPLACGNAEHRCGQLCHADSCPKCTHVIKLTCYCGRSEKDMPCGTSGVSCGARCGRALGCGNHTCEQLCHSGPCAPCVADPASKLSCCCGKRTLSALGLPPRTSCLDPIPSCGSICGARLLCGRHFCDKVCHSGACAPCFHTRDVTCACGGTKGAIPCSSDPNARLDSCTRLCDTLMSCKRHRCSRRCCAAQGTAQADVHICTLVCGRLLPCKLHTCENICHPGHCGRCLNSLMTELSCRCGREVIQPPVPCGTKPPPCNEPCRVPRACGHESTPHPCHFGPCPPCVVLVNRFCAGGHELRKNLPCHVTTITCGNVCNKPRLECGGTHTCSRLCHPPPCSVPAAHEAGLRSPTSRSGPVRLPSSTSITTTSSTTTSSTPTTPTRATLPNEEGDASHPARIGSCGEKCGRLLACGHGCAMPCHPLTPCPDVPCMAQVTVSCKCGRISRTDM
eukprot:gnl/Spiro4/17350_TR9241_c1_g1_i1.p1 gnl/Spiro4/17350_TR9241_c1_g1~~gnl/Spiro4/17350_TR9241_c1_g1_i1.p1  ORF type:complete len:780 (+),score=66.23 gnl/Spiro4/17350_TR9241_c1_g1_i1:338-2341(+)